MADYDSDQDEESNGGPVDERRQHHNALERKRRDHIKDSFDSLKAVVPSIQHDSKSSQASRSSILKSAAEYIQESRSRIANNQKDIDELETQNRQLQMQIAQFEQRGASAGSAVVESSQAQPQQQQPPALQPQSPLSDTDSSASGLNDAC